MLQHNKGMIAATNDVDDKWDEDEEESKARDSQKGPEKENIPW